MFKPSLNSQRTQQLLLLALLLLTAACVVTVLAVRMRPEQKSVDEPLSEELPQQSAGASEAEQAAAQAAMEALRSHRERKAGFYTILVSGVDDGNGGSDTNILLAVDTEGGSIYGASIPRDAKAVIDGKERKINYAYNKGGMTLLAEVVSGQLGVPVDYTVLVDLKGFAALVNAIGGIDFYVPLDMDYDDEVQNLAIHFTKGMQHLNGEDALKVVRFRHNNDGTGYGSEDIGRMETQQKFLKAVAKKMLSASNLSKVDDYVKIFNKYVETDLTLGNLAWLGGQAIRIGADGVDFCTLPNEWRSPFIYLLPDEVLALVNGHLNPFVEDRVAEDLDIPA